MDFFVYSYVKAVFTNLTVKLYVHHVYTAQIPSRFAQVSTRRRPFVRENVTRRKKCRKTNYDMFVPHKRTSRRPASRCWWGWRITDGGKQGGKAGINVRLHRWPCCCAGRMWALVRPHTHTRAHTQARLHSGNSNKVNNCKSCYCYAAVGFNFVVDNQRN